MGSETGNPLDLVVGSLGRSILIILFSQKNSDFQLRVWMQEMRLCLKKFESIKQLTRLVEMAEY